MVIWTLLAALTSASVWAMGPAEYSPHREPGRSYLEYKNKARLLRTPPPTDQTPYLSPIDLAMPLRVADLPRPPAWESEAVLVERFGRVRDHRFLLAENNKNFPRRLTWLYPDDGCFARAALAIRNLNWWSAPAPKKIFAFGDLIVKSPNAVGGEITWWYHVAPIVEVGGKAHVLDPAIEPRRPLPLRDWLSRMSHDPNKIEVAICEAGTYVPGDDCSKPSDGVEDGAVADEHYFLDLEWQRLVDLKRIPERELGDDPPWAD